MNVFLILNENFLINSHVYNTPFTDPLTFSLKMDLIRTRIIHKLPNCKITIFNNTDYNINNFFENNLITVINKKYNSLYFNCIVDYIIENYDTMPDKFIFWQIKLDINLESFLKNNFFQNKFSSMTSNEYIDQRIVNYINQIDNCTDCDLFYISNYISNFIYNSRHNEIANFQKIYLLLFGEEFCENLTFNMGEENIMLMNKKKIHRNSIDHYKKILDYFTTSENIKKVEPYFGLFMEKIFTGVFTNNVRVSDEQIKARKETKRIRIEEETKRIEEETKRIEEETRRIEEETRRMKEEETRRMKEEETRRIEEEETKRKEEEKIENLIGPIEKIENLLEFSKQSKQYKPSRKSGQRSIKGGKRQPRSIQPIELIEIMENDMMFDINIIGYVDNTIKLC